MATTLSIRDTQPDGRRAHVRVEVELDLGAAARGPVPATVPADKLQFWAAHSRYPRTRLPGGLMRTKLARLIAQCDGDET